MKPSIDLWLYMLRNALDNPPLNWTPHQDLAPQPSISWPLLPGQEYPWLELPKIYYMHLPHKYPQHWEANKSVRLAATDGKRALDNEDIEEGDMATAAADVLWESDTSDSVQEDIAVGELEDSEQDMASAAADAFYDSEEKRKCWWGEGWVFFFLTSLWKPILTCTSNIP